MKIILILLAAVFGFSSCATTRTVRTDPIMRVAIDPRDMEQTDIMRLQVALMQNHSFQVVDRGRGYAAAKHEQEDEHKDNGNRYESPEKYAEWGKLYGVGGVIVANTACEQRLTFAGSIYYECQEQLVLYDATTGQVMAAAEGKAETDDNVPSPGWAKVVDKLADAFPSKMINDDNPHQTVAYKGPLKKYRQRIQKENEDRVSGREPASQEE